MFSADVIIVTHAGGNLGAACLALLVVRGARVAAVGRTQGMLDNVLSGLSAPERHWGMAGIDLTDAAACAGLVEQVRTYFRRVDGLVNMVGTFATAGIGDSDAAQWELMFKVNLTTALNMCGHACNRAWRHREYRLDPGTIDTPWNRPMMLKADPANWVTSVQVAEVIAFLLADAGSGVTRIAIPVTGRA